MDSALHPFLCSQASSSVDCSTSIPFCRYVYVLYKSCITSCDGLLADTGLEMLMYEIDQLAMVRQWITSTILQWFHNAHEYRVVAMVRQSWFTSAILQWFQNAHEYRVEIEVVWEW